MAISFALMYMLADVTTSSQTNAGVAGLGMYEMLSLIFGAATVVFGVIGLRLSATNSNVQATLTNAQSALNACEASRQQFDTKNRELERRIETLQEYARATPLIEYVYQDIILLGPRHAGKTSVAELWTKPWTDIDGMPHTTNWKAYEATIFPLGTKRRQDATFGVERIYERVLRVRIHDYPGDDEFRRIAIRALPQIQSQAVLLLFLDLETDSRGLGHSYRNNQYYSKAFCDSIEEQTRITSKLAKVIMVFNKIDLLPMDWDLDRIRKALRAMNADADGRINSLFSSMLEYHFVSATTNQGLISLLGSAASAGLPAEAKTRFEEHLSKLYTKGTRGLDSSDPNLGRQRR